MTCKNCGATLKDDMNFCNICGTAVSQPIEESIPSVDLPLTPPAPPVVPPVTPPVVPPVAPAVNLNEYVKKPITEKDLPEKYQPLGAWSYFWLSILFTIPIIGFIFLMIFTFSDGNVNRRSFARSYW